MPALAAWASHNAHWVVATFMALTSACSLFYVLAREPRLIRSPVVFIIVGGPLYTAAAALAFGELRPALSGHPVAGTWLGHVLLDLTACALFAMITALSAKLLPNSVRNRPLLYGAFKRAPVFILSGWLLASVVLWTAPASTAPLGDDLSAWGFAFRWSASGPALFCAVLGAVLLAVSYAQFGPPRTPSESVLKMRIALAAAGAVGWAMLYLHNLGWAQAALMLGRPDLVAYDFRRALLVPIFATIALSYLLLLLIPYRPTDTTDRMARFRRYRMLTEAMELKASGFSGRHWMSASAYARADRLIELTAEALGLSQATRLTATDAYALASISTISPHPASAPTTPHDVATNPDSLEEFLRLHNDFLNEADDSPRKRYAQQNRYALAVPYALTLVGRAQPVTFSSPQSLATVQLLALTAADNGIPKHSHNPLLQRFSALPPSHPVRAAYASAKRKIERAGV